MEKIAVLLIPVLLGVLLIRLLLVPMGLAFRLAVHAACGFVCLWLLNLLSPFTGVLLPVNQITVLTAGIFGLPGIGLLALLALM